MDETYGSPCCEITKLRDFLPTIGNKDAARALSMAELTTGAGYGYHHARYHSSAHSPAGRWRLVWPRSLVLRKSRSPASAPPFAIIHHVETCSLYWHGIGACWLHGHSANLPALQRADGVPAQYEEQPRGRSAQPLRVSVLL